MSDEREKRDFGEGIIIDRPALKTRKRNLTEWSLSFLGWVLWFFLLRPFILLVTWVFGYDIVYVQMYKLEGYKNLDRFLVFALIVMSIYIVLRAWNVYNARRFRGKDRRRRAENADPESMAKFFETTPEKMKALAASKSIDAEFLDNGVVRMTSTDLDEPVEVVFDPQNMGDKLVKFRNG